MSRAIDPKTASSIQSEDLQPIYNSTVSALQIPWSGPLLEIEILGSSHALPPGQHLLIDENSVGIPKTKLVQAFIFARLLFIKLLRDCPESREGELWNATTVMLLMDPEHVTAANARKRLIQWRRGSEDLESILKKELHFVDSYLTSRLHRHTKSPTLWSHRRWLLEQHRTKGIEHDVLMDLTSVVLIAAERHPRNYYAWNHMRWLTQKSGFRTGPLLGHSEATHQYEAIVSTTQAWCLRNPEDTSGWSFLLFLCQGAKEEVGNSVCQDVLRLAIAYSWTNEAVWVFLRTLAASSNVRQVQRTRVSQAVDTLLAVQPGSATLQSAKAWCSNYRCDLSLET